MNNSEKRHLIDKIREAHGLTDKEKADLINFLNESKTYGLVWEKKTEDIEEKLREELPVLVERNDEKIKPIISKDPDAPNHLIIEGDNLAALTDLSYTHAGKIDVIYIDPPYNTGNKDFIYNDSYVDKEDSYRHSKWLSFMSKRLKIAKNLLSDRGVIFISIDDNEQANLKILCDEIFQSTSYITSVPRITKLQRSAQEKHMDISHDYVLCYARSEDFERIIKREIDENKVKKDNNGFYIEGDTKAILADKSKGYSEGGDYDFEYNGILYSPIDKNGLRNRWLWTLPRMKAAAELGILVPTKNSLRMQLYLDVKFDDKSNKMVPKNPNLIWHSIDLMNNSDYTNTKGSQELKEMGGDLFRKFNNPKPLRLIKFLILLNSIKTSNILDFFAGSGTTLHATMQLNKEDGGKRTCILCTNNENNICEDVTYERNKRVIEGYTKPNGEKIEGLKDNNLRYYRTEFVSRERTNRTRRELMYKLTPLLNIKEDLYTEKFKFGRIKLNPKGARYFEDDKKKMLVIYRPEFIPYFVEEIDKMEIEKPILVYVYSPGKYAFDDEFEIVAEKVQLCALPQAIIDAMSRVLPDKKEEELIPDLEIKNINGSEEIDLFANFKED